MIALGVILALIGLIVTGTGILFWIGVVLVVVGIVTNYSGPRVW